MEEQGRGTAAFWSYTHADDAQDGERITRLAERLRAEYSLLTGDELTLFVDREGISWGDEWRQRIDEALQSTTFFIPIITPRYFRSAECRKELLKFATAARALGVEDLILPIRYVRVPGLGDDNSDEAIALVARMQYVNWEDLRLEDEDGTAYRRAVNELAVRLAELNASVALRPSVAPTESTAVGAEGGIAGEDPYTDESPGFADLMGEFQGRLDAWTATMHAFPAAMEAFTAPVKRAGAQMKNRTFAQRIPILRRLAAQLEGPAEELASLGEGYAAQLLDVDPGVRAILEHAAAMREGDEGWEMSREMFVTVRSMVDTAQQTAGALEGMLHEMRKAARQSRDIRPPLGRAEAGLRGVLDGQAVMGEWIRMIDDAERVTGDLVDGEAGEPDAANDTTKDGDGQGAAASE